MEMPPFERWFAFQRNLYSEAERSDEELRKSYDELVAAPEPPIPE